MRNPERIPKILEAIKKFWEAHPDLRLGQLISGLTEPGQEVFYLEDDLIPARLMLLGYMETVVEEKGLDKNALYAADGLVEDPDDWVKVDCPIKITKPDHEYFNKYGKIERLEGGPQVRVQMEGVPPISFTIHWWWLENLS